LKIDIFQYLGFRFEVATENQAKSASKTTNEVESNDDEKKKKKKKKKMETEKTSPHHPLSLKSILLEAPKETSSAMFDAAFEIFFSSRGREEDEQQQQQQQPMVLLRIARAKEKLEAHFRGREEEMEAMAFLEYLKTRVVARVVEKKTGAGEEEEEEEEEAERRMRLGKVVESVLENNEEEDEEENEKARNRLKKILLAKSVAWFEKKSKTRGENDGREAVDGGSVDDDTVVERLAATNLVGKESEGRRSLGIKTPRLVEYDWTAYATRASSSALESKASRASSSSSSSSSSRFRLSLRVASDGGREDEKENTASREDIQHHDLDLDLDSLAVLVDALRDAKSAVAFGGGNGEGGGGGG
jgi:hypothetical protein